MLLYHFTAHEYLPEIALLGLTKGEVPLSSTEHRNAVWLTSDGQAAGHGLIDGRELTAREKQLAGIPLHQPARFPNKRALRMKVAIPRGDRALASWPLWAQKRMTPQWYATLNCTGGNKARTWFLYWGTIDPSWIREVLDLSSGSVIEDWQTLPDLVPGHDELRA